MSRRAVWIVLALILALAVGLRFYRITGQSLWNDEGTSAALATRDLATISRNAADDIHPPMYYWLLHFWVGVWGNSDLALRSLSAMLGVGLVAVVFLIGNSLFAADVGLLAAFLAAISPFQVYYSQETRMYMLLAFLAALGTYALIRWLQAERNGTSPWAWAALYGTTAVLSLYTHYSFPLIWAVWIVTYLAFWWWHGRPRTSLLRWAGVQVGVLLLYLPWLPTGLEAMRRWPAISEPHSLGFFVQDAWRLFLAGDSLALPRTDLLLLLVSLGIVALAGLLPNRREHDDLPAWLRGGLVGLWLGVPILAQWALSLLQPAYRPKFFLVAAPAFALLIARGALWPLRARPQKGLTRLWSQGWLLLAGLAVAGIGAQSLNNYYYDPALARDDYRSLARYVEAFGGPDDAVLINAPTQIETFVHYYDGASPVFPLPLQRPLDEEATVADLRAMTEGRNRVFAVYWATEESDPGRVIESWMDAHTFKASDDWFGSLRFVVYAVPQEAPAEIEHPLDATLGDAIALEGYTLLNEDVPSGGIVQLTLFWQALSPITERYKVFVHLLDAGGHVIAQRDAEPGGGAVMTTAWQPGEQIADNYGVPVLPGTPPGDYRLEIGMYSLSDGTRLVISQDGAAVGDHLLLDPIRVSRPAEGPPLSAIPMQKRMSLRFGPLELGGVNVDRLGYEGQNADLRPGDVVHLTLFWRAAEAPAADYEIVVGDQGTAVLSEGQPAEGRYPTSQWAAGEVVRDDRYLALPADLLAGTLHLNVSVRGLPDGEWMRAQSLCTIRVVQP